MRFFVKKTVGTSENAFFLSFRRKPESRVFEFTGDPGSRVKPGMTAGGMLTSHLMVFYFSFVFLAAPIANAAETDKATVMIRESETERVIPPMLFGSNIQWSNQGDGILDSGFPIHWFPGVIDAVKKAGVKSLRFPGGSLADRYDWKSSVGPFHQRRDGAGFDGKPVPSYFGTDEFLNLCELTKAEPVLTINWNGEPEDAADWVDYLEGSVKTRWGAERAKNGRENPRPVIYWEVGNEMYSAVEPGFTDAKTYAKKYLAFAKAMRSRSKSIKIGINLEASFLQAAWMDKIYPHMKTWNEEVLQIAAPEVDFGILHFYAPYDTLFLDSNLTRLVLSAPLVFRQNVAEIQKLIQKYCKKNVELAVTEYSTFFGEKGPLNPRIHSVEGALFDALLFFEMMKNPQIQMAQHWSLLNNGPFGMLQTEGGSLLSSAKYPIFQRLQSFSLGKLLDMTISCPAYSVDALGNVPRMDSVPVIEGVAVRNTEGRLQIALVNRSVSEILPCRVQIPEKHALQFSAVTLVPERGLVVWDSPRNFVLKPDSSGSFSCDLPPLSLTVISES